LASLLSHVTAVILALKHLDVNKKGKPSRPAFFRKISGNLIS
jgi:phosphopantetheinyl transferase